MRGCPGDEQRCLGRADAIMTTGLDGPVPDLGDEVVCQSVVTGIPGMSIWPR